MKLSSTEFREIKRYLRSARDNVADVRDLVGAGDRHQAARLGRIVKDIEAEIAEIEKKIVTNDGGKA